MNNFTIINKIGEGAYSTVFKVRRVSDQKTYALKKVKMGKLSEKEKSNALNEVRILASIEQDNIISYKESFFDDSTSSLCIVMEFADGGDLQEKIDYCKRNGSNISEEKCWLYFTQAVVALKTLHDMNIVHRDIKSANFFLTSSGSVKLGDLNVSKVARKGSLLITQTGTPYYASPEVWQDKPYDAKSDIWSLGCVLYEMAGLQPPYRANDMNSLGKKVCEGRVPLLPLAYSKELNNIVKMCLQQQPRYRPNCQELLNKCLKNVPASVAPSEYKNEDSLLNTLKVPRLLNQIGACLPQANYESSTPYGKNQGKTISKRVSDINLPSMKNQQPIAVASPQKDLHSQRGPRFNSNANAGSSANLLDVIQEHKEEVRGSRDQLHQFKPIQSVDQMIGKLRQENNDYKTAQVYNYGSAGKYEKENELKSPVASNQQPLISARTNHTELPNLKSLNSYQTPEFSSSNKYNQNYSSLAQNKALRHSGAAIMSSSPSLASPRQDRDSNMMRPAFASLATQDNQSGYQKMLGSPTSKQFEKGKCYQMPPMQGLNLLHASNSPHQKQQGNNSKIAALSIIHSEGKHYQSNGSNSYRQGARNYNMPPLPPLGSASTQNKYSRY